MRKRRFTPVAAAVAAVLWSGACSEPAGTGDTAPAPATTEAGRVGTVTWPAGSAEMCLLVADSAEERRRGLSAREDLGGFDGMLFVFDETRPHRFWMKDTLFPIELVPLDDDGGLGEPIPMQPCPGGTGDPCPTYGPAAPYSRALELPAGELSERGIDPSSAVFVLGTAQCQPRR